MVQIWNSWRNTCPAEPLPAEDGNYDVLYLAIVLFGMHAVFGRCRRVHPTAWFEARACQPAAWAMQPIGSALAPLSAGGTVCQFAAEPAGAVPGSDAGGKT